MAPQKKTSQTKKLRVGQKVSLRLAGRSVHARVVHTLGRGPKQVVRITVPPRADSSAWTFSVPASVLKAE